jgi:hypothetical protein
MNSLAIVSIVLGSVIIIARGPMVVAPKGTLAVFRQLIQSPARIRILGVFVALLGLAMVATARGIDQSAAQVILVFGWFLSLVSIFLLLLFPSLYRGLASFFLEVFEETAAFRAVGVIGVAFGVFFLYLGIAVL